MYTFIGVLNTAIHWSVFFAFSSFGFLQAFSNLAAFSIASTFSYYMNSKFNFKKKAKGRTYFLFVVGLGALSLVVGACADKLNINSFVTLIVFSSLSLILGFIYSKYIVFK
ncbi:GtrA family protein [Scandinavium sp. H11S7]|uniref:Bactoprenol-linked glucose translocase n=2 Tax=Scandinavium hiltneri TaxID=2926519 RepID=A0ABT2E0T4_9ENTR|nr:GtrA family protein [Scandinavium hiltneri]